MGRGGGSSVWRRVLERQGFRILTLLKYLPIKKYPLQACHCFTKGTAPAEAIWPGKLCTGQAPHTVVTLIGLTTVRNMLRMAGDFISTDFSSERINKG